MYSTSKSGGFKNAEARNLRPSVSGDFNTSLESVLKTASDPTLVTNYVFGTPKFKPTNYENELRNSKNLIASPIPGAEKKQLNIVKNRITLKSNAYNEASLSNKPHQQNDHQQQQSQAEEKLQAANTNDSEEGRVERRGSYRDTILSSALPTPRIPRHMTKRYKFLRRETFSSSEGTLEPAGPGAAPEEPQVAGKGLTFGEYAQVVMSIKRLASLDF